MTTTPSALSKGACLLIWAGLLALMLLNLGLSYLKLGPFNIALALVICTAQMLLMLLFFMNVRHEKRLMWFIVSAGFIWLIIMIDLTMNDYLTRTGPIHQILHNGFPR